MADTLRAFVAIDLPDNVKKALGKAQDDLKKSGMDIRWVKPEAMHLTLKFLGDIATDTVDPLGRALGTAAQAFTGFSLSARGLGVFPDFKKPRVVWAGLAGDTDTLASLAGQVETGLETLGFEKENRPFQAHLTLGRIKKTMDGKALARAINDSGQLEDADFTVDAITLYQSTLKPTGAEYTELCRARLDTGLKMRIQPPKTPE